MTSSVFTPRQQRAAHALLGSVVADAATRPLHWLYDADKVREHAAADNGGDVAFLPESRSPFYSVPTGQHSPYGDTTLAMVRSLSRTGGKFSRSDFIASLVETFGEGTPYATSLAAREAYKHYDPVTKRQWRDPVPGPWVQASTIEFLRGVAAAGGPEAAASTPTPLGSTTINEADGLCGVIPLVCLLSATEDPVADDEFEAVVRPTVQILSAGPANVEYAVAGAFLLRHIILHGGSLAEALVGTGVQPPSDGSDASGKFAGPVHDAVKSVQSALATPYSTIAHEWGTHCGNPDSFKCVLHSVLTHSSFQDTVRAIISEGGCNCSRAVFGGALLGALYPTVEGSGVPQAWVDRTVDGSEVQATAARLLGTTAAP